MDIEEQYEKIYRYCFYRIRERERAEDITQETFLRWFASDTYRDKNQTLQYLYTIARNLCIDEYRRPVHMAVPEELPAKGKDIALSMALHTELDKLSWEERELILLRYVNEVPMEVLCKMYGQSRFSLYRKLKRILKILRQALD